MVSTAVRTFARGIPWNLFLLTLGCGLFALGVKAIAIPHMLISGGVFGTALLINYMTETLSPAVWNVLLNIPIFIAGWLFVGRRFVLYSLYGLAVVSVATQYLDMHSIGCDGGLTIISIALHKRYGISVGQFSLLYNITLFVLAFSMYNPDSMLYSLIMIFVYSKVMDYVSTIFNQRKMVLIISTQHAAIREDILTHLHRGATLLSGSGGFTGEQRPVLLTVVQHYQIRLLEELIFRHDKQAFVIIENTLNVLGKGFSCVKEYK